MRRAYQSARSVLEHGLQGSGLTVSQVEIVKLLREPGVSLEQLMSRQPRHAIVIALEEKASSAFKQLLRACWGTPT